MNLVINKQSSIFLQDGKTIYFDPWDLTVEAPKADAIFITHEHSDHYQCPANRCKRIIVSQGDGDDGPQ